jgi:hypothetical protein
MYKDIIKICKKYNINYYNGWFTLNEIKVSQNDFIKYIFSKKFTVGLEDSIVSARNELFNESKRK